MFFAYKYITCRCLLVILLTLCTFLPPNAICFRLLSLILTEYWPIFYTVPKHTNDKKTELFDNYTYKIFGRKKSLKYVKYALSQCSFLKCISKLNMITCCICNPDYRPQVALIHLCRHFIPKTIRICCWILH